MCAIFFSLHNCLHRLKDSGEDFLSIEHKLMGGSAIATDGTKNNSMLKPLIAWDTSRKQLAAQASAAQVAAAAAKARYPQPKEDVRFSTVNYQWSETKKAHFAGQTPFGIDKPKVPPKPTSASPKSLADVLQSQDKQSQLQSPTRSASKGKSKSLLDHVQGN